MSEKQTPIEAGAKAMMGIEPAEDWPTNAALGGGLTGTRDDEFRDGALGQAGDALTAALAAAEDDIRVALTDLYLHGDVTPDFVWGEICRALLEGSDR